MNNGNLVGLMALIAAFVVTLYAFGVVVAVQSNPGAQDEQIIHMMGNDDDE